MAEKIRGDITQEQAYRAIRKAGACWDAEDMYTDEGRDSPAYMRWLNASDDNMGWVVNAFIPHFIARRRHALYAALDWADAQYGDRCGPIWEAAGAAYKVAQRAGTEDEVYTRYLIEHDHHQQELIAAKNERNNTKNLLRREYREWLESPPVYRELLRAVKRALKESRGNSQPVAASSVDDDADIPF